MKSIFNLSEHPQDHTRHDRLQPRGVSISPNLPIPGPHQTPQASASWCFNFDLTQPSLCHPSPTPVSPISASPRHRVTPVSPSPLLLIKLPARLQVVKVKNRVEHHKVAPFCLTSPDRIVREEDHMTCSRRHIYHHWTLGNLIATIQ